MKKAAFWITAVTLTGLLAGCGHATTPPVNNTVTTAPTNTISNSTNETTPTDTATKPVKKPVKKPVGKPKATKTTTHTTATTKTTSAPKPTTTSSKPSSSTTSKPSSGGSSSNGNTGNTTNSTGNSTGGGSPAPAPSSVVTQYVTLPISGNYPSGCQTAKMVYDKSTGTMEGYFHGLNDSGNEAWMIQAASGTMYYSNNGGGSWIVAPGNTYSNMPQEQGVSYTPNLVVKANTTTIYVGIVPANQYGNAVGEFVITYSNGSFSVTNR